MCFTNGTVVFNISCLELIDSVFHVNVVLALCSVVGGFSVKCHNLHKVNKLLETVLSSGQTWLTMSPVTHQSPLYCAKWTRGSDGRHTLCDVRPERTQRSTVRLIVDICKENGECVLTWLAVCVCVCVCPTSILWTTLSVFATLATNFVTPQPIPKSQLDKFSSNNMEEARTCEGQRH
jgi:hypothetical protein